jgi:hypothetical protein
MKKVLIGCGVVFLVLLLICTGVTVWGVLTAQKVGQRYSTAIAKVEALNAKYPHTPTKDGKFTEEQLERYFDVRDFVMNDLKTQPLIAKVLTAQANKTEPNIGMMEIMSFATSYPPDLMTKTVEEMERRQMGPGEYFETGRLIYATIEQGQSTGIETMTELYDKVKTAVETMNTELTKAGNNQDTSVDFTRTMRDLSVDGDLPIANFEALSVHKDRILEFPQLTFFEFLVLKKMGQEGHSLPPITLEEPQAQPE